jgi:hypothetical protein
MNEGGGCLSGIMKPREDQTEEPVVAPPAEAFRVCCRKALVLEVTPLLVPAVAVFADDLGATVRITLT